MGATEKALRDLFAQAKKSAPCIICIDEIDTLGGDRMESNMGRGAMQYAVSTLNQLLTLLSSDHPNVVVIGTTYRLESLDGALTRPGRFDRVIQVGLPSRTERKEILEVHTKDLNLASNVCLEDIAALTLTYSGAKLEALVNEAARYAARRNSKKISQRDFDEAFNFLTMGVSGRKVEDALANRQTAIHEGGHALVGHLLGEKLHMVSILKRGEAVGVTKFVPCSEDRNPSKQKILDAICVRLAGRAAEELAGTAFTGSSDDLKLARAIAEEMIFSEGLGESLLGSQLEVAVVMEEQLERAKVLLQENQAKLDLVVEGLLKHDQLDRADFIAVLRGKPLPSKKGGWFFRNKGKRDFSKAPKLPPKKESPHQTIS